jgi:Rieske Fe-S protein
MKLDYSLITRRTFLNTLFFGWIAAFFSGTFYALMKFAFPTLGKEPDFVVLNRNDFKGMANNTVKPFPWGGTVGLYYKKENGSVMALKGVCSHMECNVAYKPAEKRFYCACHQGWFDDTGKTLPGRRRSPWRSSKSWRRGRS